MVGREFVELFKRPESHPSRAWVEPKPREMPRISRMGPPRLGSTPAGAPSSAGTLVSTGSAIQPPGSRRWGLSRQRTKAAC